MKLKKLLKSGLALGLCFGLAACSSGSKGAGTDRGSEQAKTENAESSQEKKAETDGKEIELKIPTYLAGENVGAVFFLPQVERFNEKYAGKYKVVVEEVVQDSYAEKIKQLAGQNKLPTLVHSPGSGGIDTQWFKQVILDNDMAYDLTEFGKENPDVAAAWIEGSKDFCTVDGKLICNPLIVLRPIGLYYNKSLYKPEKDIRDMSMDEFMSGLGENKLAFMTSENAWTSSLMLAALIANEDGGVDLLNNNTSEKLWDYNTPVMVNAVGKLQKLLQNNASSNTVGAAYADAANAFMSNNAALICNGSWMASEFNEDAKDKWSNGFDGKDVKTTIYPGNIALANPKAYGDFWISNAASDEQKEAAKAFLAFRSSKEEIEAFILAEGGNAPNIKHSDDFLNKLKENDILYQLDQSMNENTKFVATLGDIFPASVADTEFGKLLPKLIDNSLTPEQFCAELTKKAQEAKQ